MKKGTPLFVIEPQPYKVKLEQAQAAEEGAKAALINAQAEFTRQQELQAKDVSTQANLDKARANRDTSRANVLQAQANTQTAEINLGYTTVSAPFDGVVTARKVSVGELVGGDQPSELCDHRPARPDLGLVQPQRARRAARARHAGRARREARQTWSTRCRSRSACRPRPATRTRGCSITPTPLSTSRPARCRCAASSRIPNRALLPGYFVRVRVPMHPVQALLVPEIAVGSDQGGRYVLALNADNVVEQRRVQLGQTFGADAHGRERIEAGRTRGGRRHPGCDPRPEGRSAARGAQVRGTRASRRQAEIASP